MKQTKQVNIHEAKTELSRLISQALLGDKVIIARAGKPEVQLVPIQKKQRFRRRPGSAKGSVWIAPNFNQALPEDILHDFES